MRLLCQISGELFTGLKINDGDRDGDDGDDDKNDGDDDGDDNDGDDGDVKTLY